MKSILYLVRKGSEGLDTQVNLRLEVKADERPVYLSDFDGGVGFHYDGFSLHETKFEITLYDGDEERLSLIPVTEGSFENKGMVFSPCFDSKLMYGKRERFTCDLAVGQLLSLSHDFEFGGHVDKFEIVRIE